MPDIHKHLTISAPVDWVWAALTDVTTMSIWMQDNGVQFDPREGGAYLFFNGQTSGRIMHITAPNLLEYTWRQNTWERNWDDSLVRWELHPEGTSTHIHLIHSRFPTTNERDSHDEGWDMYWLAPMQDWLENA